MKVVYDRHLYIWFFDFSFFFLYVCKSCSPCWHEETATPARLRRVLNFLWEKAHHTYALKTLVCTCCVVWTETEPFRKVVWFMEKLSYQNYFWWEHRLQIQPQCEHLKWQWTTILPQIKLYYIKSPDTEHNLKAHYFAFWALGALTKRLNPLNKSYLSQKK